MSDDSDTAKAQLDAMLTGGVPFFGDDDQEVPQTASNELFKEPSAEQDSTFSENPGFLPQAAEEEETEYFGEEDEQIFQNEDLVFGGEENKEETQEAAPAHSAEYLQGQVDALRSQGIQPQEQQPVQFTAEQTRLMQAGQDLSNLQQNNPTLYNKMLGLVQSEMNGTVAAPQDNSLVELEELLTTQEYNGIDSTPIKKLIAAHKANSAATQRELNQYKQNSNALNQRLNTLEGDKVSTAKQQQDKIIADNVAEYHKVSADLDITIKPDSKTMTKLMGLVSAGIPVREAFFDVTGKKETDVKAQKTKPKPRAVSATRRGKTAKKQPGAIDDTRQKLHDEMFGSVKSAKSFFA